MTRCGLTPLLAASRDVDVLNTLQLLTAKPAVYLVNLTEKDYNRKKNKWLPKIFEWVQVRGQCGGVLQLRSVGG
jgi:ribosome-binding ATPase YchF (GTP1/OBG family)